MEEGKKRYSTKGRRLFASETSDERIYELEKNVFLIFFLLFFTWGPLLNGRYLNFRLSLLN